MRAGCACGLGLHAFGATAVEAVDRWQAVAERAVLVAAAKARKSEAEAEIKLHQNEIRQAIGDAAGALPAFQLVLP
mgnify:CR=1 FL=1